VVLYDCRALFPNQVAKVQERVEEDRRWREERREKIKAITLHRQELIKAAEERK